MQSVQKYEETKFTKSTEIPGWHTVTSADEGGIENKGRERSGGPMRIKYRWNAPWRRLCVRISHGTMRTGNTKSSRWRRRRWAARRPSHARPAAGPRRGSWTLRTPCPLGDLGEGGLRGRRRFRCFGFVLFSHSDGFLLITFVLFNWLNGRS